jgi:hypothetical protein
MMALHAPAYHTSRGKTKFSNKLLAFFNFELQRFFIIQKALEFRIDQVLLYMKRKQSGKWMDLKMIK